jgi:hypothetical protein
MTEERNRCSGNAREDTPCSGPAEVRESLGIYAGRWCTEHWRTSGYRKEGRDGFDPADCGETYEPEDGEGFFDAGEGGLGVFRGRHGGPFKKWRG